jgi:hypothetical protein
MSGKIVNLDLFRTEEEIRSRSESDELKSMIGKSFRNLFARTGEAETEIMKLKETVNKLMVLVEKHA